jgi:hypothetical protein
MFIFILFSIVLLPPTYVLWVYLHEISHILAAHCIVGVKSYSIKMIPEIINGMIYFGSVKYVTYREPSNTQSGYIQLAPRIFDIASAILLPLTFTVLNVYIKTALIIVLGAGLVDLFVGSIGYSDISDLKQASINLNISPWVFRIIGFTIMLMSISLFLLGYHL